MNKQLEGVQTAFSNGSVEQAAKQHLDTLCRKQLSRALAWRKRGRYTGAMSITAIVENGMIKLPVQVPDGTKVEITLPQSAPGEQRDGAGSFFDSVRDLIGSADGLPEDFAAEHDHYIHGTPKRGAK